MARKTALGKGLRALIPDVPIDNRDTLSSIVNIQVTKVSPNPFQPREHFSRTKLEELKNSIAEKGIVQPITVRPHNSGYQLIAGERRLRAVQDLGLETIPAYILDAVSDEDMLEMSIIENIHREDLNPLDIARGYQRLIDEIKLTQEEVAQKVGKDRTTVTNFLRLLTLPRRIQESLSSGELSMGHARALITLNNSEEQIRIWKKTLQNALSVRRVEQLVRDSSQEVKKLQRKDTVSTLPRYLKEAEDRLRQTLATQVRIKSNRKGGVIDIEYYSTDDLDRLITLICRK